MQEKKQEEVTESAIKKTVDKPNIGTKNITKLFNFIYKIYEIFCVIIVSVFILKLLLANIQENTLKIKIDNFSYSNHKEDKAKAVDAETK